MRILYGLILLLLLAFPAQAAIGVSEGVAEISVTTNAATYAFGSFTPTASSTLVVIAFGTGTVDDGAMTNTSGTALTWTRKTSRVYNTVDTLYVFWANTPSSTAASVYTVDFTGDNATGCFAYMFVFTGSDILTADPIKQVITNNATSTNATVTFTTALDTLNGYAAGWGGQLGANSSTPPTSWTEIGDTTISNPTANGSAAFRAGGETGTTYTFTNASTAWGMAAVEVYVAGAGPVGGMGKRVIWM